MKFSISERKTSLLYGQKLTEQRENLVAQRLGKDLVVVAAGWNGHEASGKIDLFKHDAATDSLKRLDTLQRTPGALSDNDL